MDPKRSKRYHAWLLRFWSEPDANSGIRAGWRLSLEDPHTRRRHGFTSLESFMNFLCETLDEADPGSARPRFDAKYNPMQDVNSEPEDASDERS